MHIHLMHHGRKWRRVENHMRCHECAECGATVHDRQGQAAQKKHERFHEQLAMILQALHGRVEDGLTEPVPWTAAVDEEEADLEAIEAS